MNRPYQAVVSAFIVLSLASPVLHAETGDYSGWQTFKNLFKAPRANNKVAEAETDGPYPLAVPRPGFDDGFKPKRYLKWQTIQMDPATGASCGNGSPYKIFVNRSPNTSNMLVYMEGGGACWDEPSCTGNLGKLSARNPDGIPDNYMRLFNVGASLVSPFVVRLHPWERVETQDWTLVYVPYCTGDVYTGDAVKVYEDPEGEDEDLVWHHSGLRNSMAAISWIRNNLEQPGQMLSTGCSAGGVGALASYDLYRSNLKAERNFLLDDSGPLYAAPLFGSETDYPSLPLARRIRDAWGLDGDGSDSSPLGFLASRLPAFDFNDSGSMYRALADKYPNDRMGQVHFWQDLNFSRFSYERFYPEIDNAATTQARDSQLHALWDQDTSRLKDELAGYDNFGYFFPNYRDLNDSHCATIVDFNRADIQEKDVRLEDFIDNILNGSGPVLSASEDDRTSDQKKRRNWIYAIIDSLL